MNVAEDGEVIGMSSGEVVIDGPRTDARVRLRPAVLRSVVARLSAAAEEGPTTRVYLILENIQGTRDASVLRVYLRLPADTNAVAGRPGEFRAGSVGLYGLRRASAPRAGSAAQGLRFVLDVTSFFEHLSTEGSSCTDELIVSIRPHHALPPGSPVVIGRIRICRKDHEGVLPSP